MWVEGSIYHVMSRGSDRRAVVHDEGDFVDLERILLAALAAEGVAAHAWVLMPNHWHGLLRCPAQGLSRLMQRVNQPHALRLDRRHGRVGHVWQNRCKAVEQVTEAQVVWTLRYLARNPVEAGLCSRPEHWRWSSYAATIGLRPAPAALRVEDVLAPFGRSLPEAVARFREFVETV